MKVEIKQIYAISDELPRLMFDVFGWTVETEADDDAMDELAHHVAMGIKALIPDRDEVV